MTVNKFQIIPFKGVDLGDIFFELGNTNGDLCKIPQNPLNSHQDI